MLLQHQDLCLQGLTETISTGHPPRACHDRSPLHSSAAPISVALSVRHLCSFHKVR